VMRMPLGRALAAVLVLGALLAPTAGAKVRYPFLAPSFGSDGYLPLPSQMAAPEGESSQLESLGAAPSGAVYATESVLVGGNCGPDNCRYRGYLGRVDPDGSIATTFGGSGRVEIGTNIEQLAPVISDPQGRALVVTADGSNVTVRRYRSDGSLDAGFGGAGATTFDCRCGAPPYRQLEVGVDGQERIIVSIGVSDRAGAGSASILARLLPGGAIDGSFGNGGVLRVGSERPPLGIAFGSGDAIYVWGYGPYSSCCEPVTAYVHRISAKGLIDARFDATADRNLANIGPGVGFNHSNLLLVVRPQGRLDFYVGSALIRLRADGRTDTKFGTGGVRSQAREAFAATLVGHGRTLGLGMTSGGVTLFRLQADGRPDRSFGQEGETRIDGVEVEGGLTLARLNGRRAQVLDRGYTFCRGRCAPNPKLVRYRVGPKR
jgi:uncharacterized delta-60 repeat protein